MKEINKKIVKRFLKGKASAQQSQQVVQWYESLERAGQDNLGEKEIEEVGKRIYDGVKSSISTDYSKKRAWLFRVAAVIAILLTLGSLAGIFSEDQVVSYTAGDGQRAKVVLSDGTEVVLNSNSSIIYPQKFSGDIRIVELKGEAFFSVAKNPEKPFIVTVNDLDVKVLGTRFNVNAGQNEKEIRVTVQEGSVAVLKKESNPALEDKTLAVLKAEEQLVYVKDGAKAEKVVLNEKVLESQLLWKKEDLIFRNNTLLEISKELSAWYNVEFKFLNSDLKDCTYTANFDSSLNVKEVLELLKGAQKFQFTIEGKVISIDGTPCNN